MTVQHKGNQDYIGLSTDTKPTPTLTAVNAIFTETDTNDEYVNNGTAWVKILGGGGGGFAAGGSITKSGNGTTTTFTIPHGLSPQPDVYFALPTNAAARGDMSYSVDATNITLTYPVAPAPGTNNLTYVWGAGYTNTAVPGLTASSTTTLTNKTISAETNTLAFLGQPTQTWSIYYSGTTIMARNNKTGLIPYTDTSGNINTVLASIIGAITPAGTPTSIEIGEGDFYMAAGLTALDSTRAGNIKIRGQGPGLTNILLKAGCTRGFLIAGTVAVGKVLTVNASNALYSVTMSSGDAATFAVNDYVLLRSDKTWAGTVTSAAARQGEIHRIRTIAGGVITFHEAVMESYLTSDNTVVAKITMLQNITLEDLKIAPIPSGYTGQTNAILECNWIDNLQLKNVEVNDSTIGAGTNIYIRNCINSNLDVICTQTGNYPFVELPSTGQYGVYIALASQHVKLKVIGRGRWRHLVTGGGINNLIANAGIPRDITVSGTSEVCMSNAFDWHADGDGIVFQNCNITSQGSTDDDTHNTGGIASRCRHVTITGCNIGMVTQNGISLTELASNSTISGNTIHRLRKYATGTQGVGINLGTDITGVTIAGNNLYDTDSINFGIYGTSGNNNCVINGNTIINFAPIRFTDAFDVVVTGNRISNGANKAINMTGTSDYWLIEGNNARGSAVSTFVGANNVKVNNINL